MDNQYRPSRSELRSKLLGQKHKPKSKIIKLFGIDVELRQPSLRTIMDAGVEEDDKYRSVKVLVEFAYVPGAEEKLFEEADIESILEWPAGDEFLQIQMAIAELSGIDIASAKEVLRINPLGGDS